MKHFVVVVFSVAVAVFGLVRKGQGQGTGPIQETAQEAPQLPSATRADALKAPVPDKPKEILELAATMNGVDVASAKPWHVILSYDQFDEDGDNVHSGTLEEFYVGPKKYRRQYAGDTLNEVEVANDSGLYRSGDQKWPDPVWLQVRKEALRPLYRIDHDLPNTRLDKSDWTLGVGGEKQSFPCIILRRTDMIVSDNGLPKYCFEPGTVLVRYVRGGGWDETVYNNVVMFQGHFVASDLAVTHAGKNYLKIHLEKLEPLEDIKPSLFTPPEGSSGPLNGRVPVPAGLLISDYLISRSFPNHPQGANGKVIVDFVIGKDGHVIQAHAADGPNELRKPAEEAVRSFRFRPFSVLDQPVEAESSLVFEFHGRLMVFH